MDWHKVNVMPLHMVDKPPYTIDAPGAEAKEGETLPRRHIKAKDGLWTVPEEGVNTVFDIVKRASEKYGQDKGISTRKTIKIHRETKKITKIVGGQPQEVDKEWQYFELSPYKLTTYTEYETLILQVGAGLRKLGLSSPDRIHLFASTRYVLYRACSLLLQ
jgi:long-chain acyl-CoA synthetase